MSEPLTTRRTPRMGRPFSSRNQVAIGSIGLVFIVVLVLAAFNASKLPLIGGGTAYTAYFKAATGLKNGDPVRIAGVKVGKVGAVTIDTDKGLVKAAFTIKNGYVGNQSTIDLKLKDLLGDKYLSINSLGSKPQPASQAIPVTRTTSPLDVYPAFTKLTDTVQNIDTDQLQQSFRVLASDFSGTPSTVKPLLSGLSRLSTTISSRDAALQSLLARANTVTSTLAARSQDVAQLLRFGNQLLTELNYRRDAIHSLLVNTQTLSTQLRGLVSDNEKTLGPLLDDLGVFLKTLKANQDNLDRGLSLLGPFYRLFDNVVGNGRWFDNYIQNLNACGVLELAVSNLSCPQS